MSVWRFKICFHDITSPMAAFFSLSYTGSEIHQYSTLCPFHTLQEESCGSVILWGWGHLFLLPFWGHEASQWTVCLGWRWCKLYRIAFVVSRSQPNWIPVGFWSDVLGRVLHHHHQHQLREYLLVFIFKVQFQRHDLVPLPCGCPAFYDDIRITLAV